MRIEDRNIVITLVDEDLTWQKKIEIDKAREQCYEGLADKIIFEYKPFEPLEEES